MPLSLQYRFKSVFFGMIIFFCLIIHGFAQQDSFRLAKPVKGEQALAIKVLGIEFTQAQRDSLDGKSIELIYIVDIMGVGQLTEINGVKDKAIQDSIFNANAPFLLFESEIFNGEPRESIYFLKIFFPKYYKRFNQPVIIDRFSFNMLKMENFDSLTLSKTSSGMVFGGIMNQFVGSMSDYLGLGGGMKIDFYYRSKNLIAGLNMNVYGTKRKKDFPINSIRPQGKYPSMIIIGPSLGFHKSRWSFTMEVDFCRMNLVYSTDTNTKDGFSTDGWSPGLILAYRLPIFQDKPLYYYNSPYVLTQNIQFSLAIRKFFVDLPEASGTMLELGICYDLNYRSIKSFKLKNQVN